MVTIQKSCSIPLDTSCYNKLEKSWEVWMRKLKLNIYLNKIAEKYCFSLNFPEWRLRSHFSAVRCASLS